MKIMVVYYSMYGHIHRMAQAVVDGAKEIKNANVVIRRVPETLSADILEKMGATEPQKIIAKTPVCTIDELADADAILFGTPTRFGNMCGQMRQFLDAAGSLWVKGALVGKIGSVFASSNTQHGGQETTINTFIPTLLHLGMIVAGLPYSYAGQMSMSEITGGSPYGATTIAGAEGDRTPSENELAAAKFQGHYVASLAAKLAH